MELCISQNCSQYEAIAQKVKDDIDSQELYPGSRLLPLRLMAKKYNTSYLTMRRAINLLCDEGVLTSRQGVGIHVRQPEDETPQQSPAIEPANKKSSFVVTFIDMCEHITSQSVYSRLLHGIEKEAYKQGIDIIISKLNSIDKFKDTNTFADYNAFLVIGDETAGLDKLFKDKSCVWAMGIDKSWGDHITFNNKQVGVLAAQEFVKRGHKTLACINGCYVGGDERCVAFKREAEALGAAVTYYNDPDALKTGSFEQHIDFSTLEYWVDSIEKSNPMPTAVFVIDVVALPLYSMLSQRGIIPGKDIEIATSNWQNVGKSGVEYKPLEIFQNPEQIGRLAVRQLQWRVDNPNERRVIIKLEPEIEK